VNTSPLVFLDNLGRLELLRYERREVYIPRAVAEEIAEKPDAAAQAVQIGCVTWIQVGNVTDETAVTLVQASLQKGKAEVIILAIELHAERLVMDAQDARRFANRCGLTVVGTLGILLAAKQRGAIASLRVEINALASLGFRANPQLVTTVLQSGRE
jgi:uncharacterized protein